MKKIDVKIGERYGRLTVVVEVGRSECNKRMFLSRCDCGESVAVLLASLRGGKTASCGCLQRELLAASMKRHGHKLNRKATSTYQSWQNMKRRCDCEKDDHYHSYGRRGITYDPRWEKFENFLEDMGEKPKGRWLDRVDNNGNYCKENCRWGTVDEQVNNKQNSHYLILNKNTYTIAQWSRITGMGYEKIRRRILRGWSDEKALTTP